VDAFCNQIFQGNPAAVCLLPKWLETVHLQHLAAEHGLPVTAFLVAHENAFEMRWFTPQIELELCGHGTLAAAFVVLTLLKPTLNTINLHSDKAGIITVQRCDSSFAFNFPAKKVRLVSCNPLLIKALNLTPEAVYDCQQERLMIVLPEECLVKHGNPDMTYLKQLEYRGFILCAPSNTVDFVSRTFYPDKPMPEDMVTGASHCYLAPYFAERLGKNTLKARQLSTRGGTLWLTVQESHITIKAQAVLYSQGIITLI